MGKGSEATIPLARAVVGGLLTSTALTLFVVPILYTLLLRDPLEPELDLDKELTDEPEELVSHDGGVAHDRRTPALAIAGEEDAGSVPQFNGQAKSWSGPPADGHGPPPARQH
jgi:hypothetical protein